MLRTFFPLLTHKRQNYWLQSISDIVIFSLHVLSLQLSNSFYLNVLRVVHTVGAVPTPCLSLCVQFFCWASGRRWSTPLKISHRNLFRNCLGHPLGIGCSSESTHTVLLVAQLKVLE
jgi:hypothetical protein